VRKRILIVSARVGAGHDGAARELARRLPGHRIERADFLDLLPGRLGPMLCDAYHRQLRTVPRSWDWLLHGLGLPGPAALAARMSILAGRNLLAVAGPDTDLVISTYPMASHAVATLRARRQLNAPLAVYLTDPSVHRLSITPGADLTIAPNATAARQALRFGAPWVEVANQIVGPEFNHGWAPGERARAREAFELPQGPRQALVVAGSWGVGDVERIARDVASSGTASPVIVCGRNANLLHRLRQHGYRHVFGWVSNMPRLMRACDVVVQNAGGLTMSEALASGLPVLTYRCLPGHGRANAKVLDQEGLVPWVRSQQDLPAALAAARSSAPLPGQSVAVLLGKLLETAAAAA
jgi:UDP-N-acetylglucosamine:LPS N-acetylglucosamine transferase